MSSPSCPFGGSDPKAGSACSRAEKVMPFRVLADVVGGERAQRCDPASRIAQVLQESIHQTSGVTPSPVLGPRSDVTHGHEAIMFGVLGDADCVAVSAEFEAAISDVLHNDERRLADRRNRGFGKFGRQHLVRRFIQVRSHSAETVLQTGFFPIYSQRVIAEEPLVDKAGAMLKDLIQ